jgi:hypothetical protein
MTTNLFHPRRQSAFALASRYPKASASSLTTHHKAAFSPWSRLSLAEATTA